MIVTFRIRRDTAAQWSSVNPVLGLGEPGLETDTRRVKYGDGATAWNALSYSFSGVAWGQITGSLANQTDLMTALGNLAPKARAINTTAPLQGGGDLSSDRTLSILAATQAAPGSMSATDKAKLDGVATGATANTGTVTSVSATGANGITVNVGSPGTTPAIAIGAANLTPTTITGGQWLSATRLQTACRVTFDDGAGNFELMANGVYNPPDLRLGAGFAGRMEFNATVGNWRFQTAANGAANSSISYVERFVIENGGTLRPGADNAQSIGAAAFRFAQLFSASGTINTSDRDAKKYIGSIPDEWLDAWAEVNWRRFKMKGGGERWHVGLVAQEVHAVFAAHGIDAFDLGLCCYNEWGDEWGEYKNGSPKLLLAAGSRWGLRYDECFALDAALQARQRLRDAAEIRRLGDLVADLLERPLA